jgi:hypothetical protein
MTARADVIPGWETISVDRLWDEFNRRAPERYGAPQSTYDALLWELREFGVMRLAERECRRRLGDLSTAQVRELVAALIRLRPKWPNVTDNLILKIGGLLP